MSATDPEPAPKSWVRELLDFWFSHGPAPGADPDSAAWWTRSEEFDAEIGRRFGIEWARQSRRPVGDFLGDPETALAAVILFDQLPRNMFRDHAESFATDHLALGIAAAAVETGYDEDLPPQQRAFVYMPFEHSERLEDQQRSLLLFIALGDEEMLRHARLHHDLIARFGRFPHRNAMLGRATRPGEQDAAAAPPW